ncbi:hypothetical protein PGQ11_014798 [Apiospora arundinis]|uniref:Uncharacterized protein n=1 Tax=Apiospora arundinis TaxID=335852 RepID=A0ABR2HU05_9PEZI
MPGWRDLHQGGDNHTGSTGHEDVGGAESGAAALVVGGGAGGRGGAGGGGTGAGGAAGAARAAGHGAVGAAAGDGEQREGRAGRGRGHGRGVEGGRGGDALHGDGLGHGHGGGGGASLGSGRAGQKRNTEDGRQLHFCGGVVGAKKIDIPGSFLSLSMRPNVMVVTRESR